MHFDANQQAVLDAAAGDLKLNILLMGYAGSGKTELAKKIADACPDARLTSMTVLGAGEAGCRSFSAFLSVFLREPPHDLSKLLAELQEKPDSLAAIRKCRTLIIDNASMLTSRLYKLADELLQLARGNSQLFGGIRLILVLDPFAATVPFDKCKYPVEPMPVHFFDSPDFLPGFNGALFFLDKLYRPRCDLLYQAVIGTARGNLSPAVLQALKRRCLGAAVDEKSPSRMWYNDFQNLGGNPRNKEWHAGNVILCAGAGQANGIHRSLKERKERRGETFVNFSAIDVGDWQAAAAEIFDKPRLAETVFFAEGTAVSLAQPVTLRCSRTKALASDAEIETVHFHRGELAVVVEFFRPGRVDAVRNNGRDVWGSFERVANDKNFRGAVVKTRSGFFIYCALVSETLVSSSGKLQRIQFPFITAAAVSLHRTVGVSAEHVYLVESSGRRPAGILYSAISKVEKIENLVFDVNFEIAEYISTPTDAVRSFLQFAFPGRDSVDPVSPSHPDNRNYPALELGSKRTFDELN